MNHPYHPSHSDSSRKVHGPGSDDHPSSQNIASIHSYLPPQRHPMMSLPPLSSYQQHQHQHQHQQQQDTQPQPLAYHTHSQPPPHHQRHPANVVPPIQPPLSYQHAHQHQQTQAHSSLQHALPSLNHAAPSRPAYQPSQQSSAPLAALLSHPMSSPSSQPLHRNEDVGHTPVPEEHNLRPLSKVDESVGRCYSLIVAQQPVRARMCGFGDKDRRPITPPPCVQLLITDPRTGEEMDISSIDHSRFVLNVDLWDAKGHHEVNLVRSSQDSSASSYSQTVQTTPSRETSFPPSQTPSIGYAQEYSVSNKYPQTTGSYPPNGTYGPPMQYFPNHQLPAALQSQPGASPFGANAIASGAYSHEPNTLGRTAMVGGQPHGMFTRNLIGSLASGAFRLSNTNGHFGIWFVLQDLSVRTEGSFRLKFSFVDVRQRDYNSQRKEDEPSVNTNRAPILATAFTDEFLVYSAKKFPGVCESTELSKTFATQGIKIPIRKDAKSGEGNDDDD